MVSIADSQITILFVFEFLFKVFLNNIRDYVSEIAILIFLPFGINIFILFEIIINNFIKRCFFRSSSFVSFGIHAVIWQL